VATRQLDDARQAWNAGDADGTLALCDALERERDTALDSAILRARVYLRIQRSNDARVLLAPLLSHVDGERAVEVRALLGTAYARNGDATRGLMLLNAASAASITAESRSEIALGVALAQYASANFAAAETALAGVDSSVMLLHARALELRGWIARHFGRFADATVFFESALAELDRSPLRDPFLEANLIAVLGNLAVELLDIAHWEAIARRAQSVTWHGTGMAYYRFWHRMNSSMVDELCGRPAQALQAARSASVGAPSSAFRIFAHCRRAAVLFAYDERLGYADLAATVREEFEAIDLTDLHAFEEVNLVPVVAATLAQIGDAGNATATLARLNALSPAQRALLTDEPAKRGYLAHVEGLVADANHDAFTAQHRYREAFRIYREIGLPRRALSPALALDAVNGDPSAASYIDELALRLPPASWVRIRLAKRRRQDSDPVFAELSRAERDVLRLLYEGYSTAEIAAQRGRTAQTIRNTVSALFKAFGVDNRGALISECRRRAIFSDAPPPRGTPSGQATR
jgi:DNA-binding CsgD family transcriptional regulator